MSCGGLRGRGSSLFHEGPEGLSLMRCLVLLPSGCKGGERKLTANQKTGGPWWPVDLTRPLSPAEEQRERERENVMLDGVVQAARGP